MVTANNRIAPEDYPHHITSDYLDGYRARRIEQLITADPEHDLESFEAMQTDMLSLPGLETAHRLARLRPRDQRELAAIERLRSWDGRMSPESIAATIYQAFTLRLAREVARAAIGDHDLAERWLDRADNGFIAHVTSPWRWQSHLLALWEEGDEELVGRPWDELALDALRGALDDLEGRLGSDQEAWRWGRVHPLVFPHALGEANPLFGWIFNRRLEVGGGQETVAQVGWDPNDPFTAIWAPCWRMVADPVRPERSRWQGFTGQSGHPASPHYDDLQADWLEGRTQPMAGEGPWRVLRLEPEPAAVSRRGQIKLSDDEQRELLESERVVVVSSIGARGWPHSMPLWYVLRGSEIWIYTYAKSQKVKNLERDPRATLLVETGHEYGELRGVQIEAEAEIHRDLELVYEVGRELTLRYAAGASVEATAAEALKAQARKRVAVRFEPRANRELGPPEARAAPTARQEAPSLCLPRHGEPQGPDSLGGCRNAPAPDHPHLGEAARAGGQQAGALLRHRGAGRGGDHRDRDRDRSRDGGRDRRRGGRRRCLRRLDHLHPPAGAAGAGPRGAHRRGVPPGRVVRDVPR